ncbi:MAG: LPS export ABC transporter permease LptG [Pseudomonadota bacterium]
MIPILDRHVGSYVILGTLGALALLVMLFSVIDLVDDLENVGRGRYTAASAIVHQLYLVPGRVLAMLPVAGLMGSLFGLGLMASSLELVAYRAAGVTIGRITLAVLKSGALLIAIALILGELVVPVAERKAEADRADLLEQHLTVRSRYGFWLRGGNTFVKVGRILPSSELEALDIYEFNTERKLERASRAKRARFTDTGWVLESVDRSTFTDEGVALSHHRQVVSSLVIDPEQIRAISVEPERLSTLGVIRQIGFLRTNGLNAARYELALWNKVCYPIVSGVLIFLAVVLVLGVLSQVTAGYRLLIGILVGVSFHIVQKMSMHMGLVFEVSPALSVLGPALVCGALGYALLRRIN